MPRFTGARNGVKGPDQLPGIDIEGPDVAARAQGFRIRYH